MATKKKMLEAAAGTAAAGGAGLDITAVFSTYLYEGNGSSQVIENGINLGQSFGSGSVKFDGSNSGYLSISSTSTLALASDYTVEMFLYNDGAVNSYLRIFNNAPGTTPSGFFYVYTNGTNIHMYNADAGSLTNVGTFSAGAWFHLAISRSGSTTRVFVNGTQSHSYTGTTNFTNNGWFIGGGPDTEFNDINISNFRVVTGTALYTSGFTPPTSELTAVTNTALLTCQGSDFFADNSSNSLTITKNGGPTFATFGPFDAADAGEGGLVWLKSRTSGTVSHQLFDTERGAALRLRCDTTLAQSSDVDTLTAFNTNGFNLGDDSETNASGQDYASWTFRKAPKFFDVQTWTGDSTSNRAIPHNLDGAVGSYFVKCTSDSTSSDWIVWHKDLSAPARNLVLNTTAGESSTDYALFSTTAPDSSNVYLGTDYKDYYNATGRTYVAYLFAHNDSGDGEFGPDGDQDIIKCGSYTEAASGAQEINLGFEPQWIMVKPSSGAGDWWMYDTMRGQSYGGSNRLKANVSDAEAAQAGYFAPTPNGFIARLSGSGFFGSGVEVVYMAVRRGQLALPESGTEVFNTVIGSGVQSPGFPVDFLIGLNDRTNTQSYDPFVKTRLLGGVPYLTTSSTAAEASGSDVGFDTMDGLTYSWPNSSAVAWYWKRAPSYFDCVAYSGTGIPRTVSHNVLGVAPEMIWVKERSGNSGGRNWAVYHSALGGTKYLFLNTTAAVATASGAWNNTNPTSSVFSVGTANDTNKSNGTYIAYLFSSLAGVSKVGSYTGSNSVAVEVNCGFTSGARFVLIKRTDAVGTSGNWYVYDSVRGIVSAADDPYLLLNTADAEASNTNNIEPLSSGFKLTIQGNNPISVNGGSYVFYAIA